MTSAQMKSAIKMMTDFAPALMKASEILEAAEQAEAILRALEGKKAALATDMAGLTEARAAQADELAKISAEVAQAKREAQDEKAKLNTILGAVQQKVMNAQQALEVAQKAHADWLKQMDADRIMKQSELDGVQRELDTFLAKLRR